MSQDAVGNPILFGGSNGGANGVMSDTWIWDGTTWVLQSPTASPPARTGAAICRDASGRPILFGGAAGSLARRHLDLVLTKPYGPGQASGTTGTQTSTP